MLYLPLFYRHNRAKESRHKTNDMKEEDKETMKEILRTAVKVKPEAKKIEKPLYYVEKSPENSITRFSLYTTEKPVLGMSRMGCQDNDIEYEPDSEFYERIDDWLKDSRFAHLQEPEFKVGDIYYFTDGSSQSIIQDRELKMLIPKKWKSMSGEMHESNVFRNTISHFYPGQKIDPSKVSYVRENKRHKWDKVYYSGKYSSFETFATCMLCGCERSRLSFGYDYKDSNRKRHSKAPVCWQPATEPEKKDLESGKVQAIINQ